MHVLGMIGCSLLLFGLALRSHLRFEQGLRMRPIINRAHEIPPTVWGGTGVVLLLLAVLGV